MIKSDEAALVRAMHALVRGHPRLGYRRIHALLQRDGWRVNRKRVHRLWRQEKLKVPQEQRKKRRLGSGEAGVVRHRAMGKDHVWAWDFIHDRDDYGRPLKWLSIVDEHTRECLGLEVARSMKARDVVDIVSPVMLIRGAPRRIRSDNGPAFIAVALRRFVQAEGVGALYIEPGSPWDQGYAESFHGRLRAEPLNAELFTNLADALALAAGWRNAYHHRRPHSSLGDQTPAGYAASLAGPPVGGCAPLSRTANETASCTDSHSDWHRK